MDGPEGVVAYVCPLKLELFYSSPLNCYPNVIFLLWSPLSFISELMDRILAVTYSCQLKIVIFIYSLFIGYLNGAIELVTFVLDSNFCALQFTCR